MEKNTEYDNYRKFYKAVFGDEEKYPVESFMPSDYKESVCFVLKEKGMGLPERTAEMVMKYFGIVDYNMPEDPVTIGNDFGIKGNSVYSLVYDATARMHWHSKGQILRMGIKKFSETYDSVYGISDELMTFQKEYQRLCEERKELQLKVKENKAKISALLAGFSAKHDLDIDEAQIIGRKKPEKRTTAVIKDMFGGHFSRN